MNAIPSLTEQNVVFQIPYTTPIKSITRDSIFVITNRDTTRINNTDFTVINNHQNNRIEIYAPKLKYDTVKLYLQPYAIQYTTDQQSGQSQATFIKQQQRKYGILDGQIDIKYDNYIFELVNSKGKIVDSRSNITSFHYQYLQPGQYSLRVLIDENNNGHYDTGTLNTKPEKYIYYTKIIDIKANWEQGNIILSEN